MQADLASIVSTTLTGVTSIAGVIIALLLYRLNRQQQRETWIRVYKEIHDEFWSDPTMTKVRYWINYDRAYLEIKPVLHKRRQIFDGKVPFIDLVEAEYKCLDELDKFYNLALQVVALNSRLGVNFEQSFWKSLYMDYWIRGCLKQGRTELQWYVETYYGELLHPALSLGKGDFRNTISERLQNNRFS